MKSIIAAGILLGMSHGAAIAGPYANVESNSSYFGSSYLGSVIEAHGGYETYFGEDGTIYFQAGPALVAPEKGNDNIELSGKVGVGYDVTDQLNVYGEYAFITGDELGSNVKAGLKYKF